MKKAKTKQTKECYMFGMQKVCKACGCEKDECKCEIVQEKYSNGVVEDGIMEM